MGIKSMSLQMIPWCFHLMTNHFSCVHIRSSQGVPTTRIIKLIKADGLVKIYYNPINVSELMHEFPKHLVCHSDSFFIGQKIPPLSEKEKLQLGHNYFLLPKQFFQSVLSFITIASFATTTTTTTSKLAPEKNEFLKKIASCRQPFVIRKTPAGSLQIRVSDEFIASLIHEGRSKDENEEDVEEEARGRICSTAQLQKEYTQLVLLSRQWKPKLDTIKESKRKRLASLGIKRRKKSQPKRIELKVQKSEHLHVVSSPSKTKVKVKGKKILVT